jgi:integrase
MTFYLEYERGKRVKLGRVGAISLHQAREMAKQHLSDAYQGDDPIEKKRKAKAENLRRFLDETYKPWLLANQRSGQLTYERMEMTFKELLPLKLNDITPWLVEKWRSRRKQDGLKATNINRELADLKACLNRAVEWGAIDDNPIKNVRLSRIDSQAKVRYLTKDEESSLRKQLDLREKKLRADRESGNQWRKERNKRLMVSLAETAYADHLKPAVLLSLNTGLRRGELFGLKWEDVDFDKRNLTVTGENAKSKKTRHVPLNDEAMVALTGWQAQARKASEYVFEGRDGKPFHDVRKSWANLLKESNINGFRWHDLRHTFASKLVMTGVDLNTVRELLGHSDYKMTLRYAHLAPEHKAAAVSKLCGATK